MLKDKKKSFTVNLLEIQYFTTSTSLNISEQWIILLKDKKKSFTVNLLEIQYFTINTSWITERVLDLDVIYWKYNEISLSTERILYLI